MVRTNANPSLKGIMAANVVSGITTRVSNNLSDVSNLGDFVTNRVNNIQKAQSGQEFVTRLQRQGLSQSQAQATQSAITAEAKKVQQQATDAAAAAARIVRKVATTAAWGSLLAAGLVIGLATVGGNRAASTRRKIDDTVGNTTPRG